MAAPAARLSRAPTRVAAVVARAVGERQSRAVVTPSSHGLGNPYSHTSPHRARQGFGTRHVPPAANRWGLSGVREYG